MLNEIKNEMKERRLNGGSDKQHGTSSSAKQRVAPAPIYAMLSRRITGLLAKGGFHTPLSLVTIGVALTLTRYEDLSPNLLGNGDRSDSSSIFPIQLYILYLILLITTVTLIRIFIFVSEHIFLIISFLTEYLTIVNE